MPKRSATGHKPGRAEALDAVVLESREMWLRHQKAIKDIAAGASVDPVSTMLALTEYTDEERRLLARDLRRRFGCDMRETEGEETEGYERAFLTEISDGRVRFVGWGGYSPLGNAAAQAEDWPRDPRKQASLANHLAWYCVNDFARRAMIEVAWDVNEAGYDVEDMAWAGCQVFSLVYRAAYVFPGVSAESPDNHPAVREAFTAILGGWIASQVSLTGEKGAKLRATLSDQGENPFETLIRELPAQTLASWRATRHEGLKGFKSDAIRSLERLGQESVFKEKLTKTTEAGEKGEEDVLLQEFELRQTMHQQRQQLEPLMARALERAPQQKAVLQRRLDGMETAEIAAELEISPNQVSVQLHNAVKKVREERKAAGL